MVKIQEGKIDTEKVKASLKRNDVGAILIFLGEPRRSAEDGDVLSINYTAFKEMAIKEMQKIEKKAVEKFSIKEAVIVHRVGFIPLQEISFLVAVSSAHRREAFDACRWIVDAVKEKVPIWKEIKYERSRDS